MLLPPFDHGQPLLRGNLHGHSTHSDGEHDPASVAGIYRGLGYDFTCISDHFWKDERFSARSILDPAQLGGGGFVAIPSAELHCYGKKYDTMGYWHIVANGLPLDFAMADDAETGPELVQRAIDAGAFVSIAHPEWYAMTSEEAMSVSHAHAVEVYNHTCMLESGRGMGLATADQLLNEGCRIAFTATDDSHGRVDDAGGGWVLVAAGEKDAESIVGALKAGRHYSSTGPEIRSISLDGHHLAVECSPAARVHVTGAGNLSRGRLGDGITGAEFDLEAFGGGFFRVTVTDSGGGRAWSNPYFMDSPGGA